jgi:GntR family transcriptional regulator
MNTLLPLYYQIKEQIRDWITNKQMLPGERMPSENELAKHFNVARLTIREAVSQLVKEGLIIRKRGQGTFVTKNEDLIHGLSGESYSFLDEIYYQVQKRKTKSVVLEEVHPPKAIREMLELGDSTGSVTRIKRIRYLGNNSFNYTINYLPRELGSRLSKKALLAKPLLQILQQDLNLKFTEAFQTIRASFADKEVADALLIPLGSPILHVERVMYTGDHNPVEAVQISYRGDLFKYIMRVKNRGGRHENVWVHERT